MVSSHWIQEIDRIDASLVGVLNWKRNSPGGQLPIDTMRELGSATTRNDWCKATIRGKDERDGLTTGPMRPNGSIIHEFLCGRGWVIQRTIEDPEVGAIVAQVLPSVRLVVRLGISVSLLVLAFISARFAVRNLGAPMLDRRTIGLIIERLTASYRNQDRIKQLELAEAGMRHDIKIPISALSTARESVAYALGDQQRTELRMIDLSIQRLQSIANYASTPRAHGAKIDRCSLDVIRHTFHTHAEMHGLCSRIEPKAEPETGSLRIPTQHVPMLDGLIANCLKNSAEVGAKHVALTFAQSPHGSVVMRLEDDGPGLSDDLLERLGNAPVRSQKPEGQGVGLFAITGLLNEQGVTVRFANLPTRGMRVTATL